MSWLQTFQMVHCKWHHLYDGIQSYESEEFVIADED